MVLRWVFPFKPWFEPSKSSNTYETWCTDWLGCNNFCSSIFGWNHPWLLYGLTIYQPYIIHILIIDYPIFGRSIFSSNPWSFPFSFGFLGHPGAPNVMLLPGCSGSTAAQVLKGPWPRWWFRPPGPCRCLDDQGGAETGGVDVLKDGESMVNLWIIYG